MPVDSLWGSQRTFLSESCLYLYYTGSELRARNEFLENPQFQLFYYSAKACK